MGFDEENLDDLLKSIMEKEEESEHSEEENIIQENTEAEENASAGFDFAIEDFGDEEELPLEEEQSLKEKLPLEEALSLEELPLEEETQSQEDISASDSDMLDFVIQDFGEEEPAPDELEDEIEDELEDDMSGSYREETNDADSESMDFETDGLAIEDTNAFDDVDALFAAVEESADNGEEQNDNVSVEAEGEGALRDIGDADDMLALLESMSEEEENAEESDESHMSEEGAAETDISQKEKGSGKKAKKEKKEKKEKKAGLFSKVLSGKKKNQTKTDEETHTEILNAEDVPQEKKEWEEIVEELPLDENLENLFGAVEQTAAEQGMAQMEESSVVTPVKNKNIFSKIFAFLTESDDEGEDEKLKAEHGMAPSDENKNILEELDEEDKKKKKKKVKGKKGQQEETPTDEDEEEEVKDTGKKKDKKKKKKEKPVADDIKDTLEDTKPGKKISKKNVAIIAGLCLTLTAVIIVLCSIVPGFFDKRKAREAYYQSDYQASYELLYGKKLDNSDNIIFNKSRIVLELNRKLDSYHNYLSIGKEVQALDALMSGVQKYPEVLLDAEEYHVTQEINAVYETILNILSDKYDISEPVAKVIISYDDLTYTRKLESIVYRTPFVMPGEETEVSTDMLPEEQIRFSNNDVDVQTDDETDRNQDIVEETEDHVYEPADLPEEELPTEGTPTEVIPQQEPVEQVNDSESTVAEETQPDSSTATGGQGQMIQGIRQPLDIQIREN